MSSVFPLDGRLKEHLDYCLMYKAYRSVMPSEDKNVVKFEKYECRQQIPYAIYADLEPILHLIIEESTSCQSSPQIPFTKKKQQHEISSYCYCVTSHNPNDRNL